MYSKADGHIADQLPSKSISSSDPFISLNLCGTFILKTFIINSWISLCDPRSCPFPMFSFGV
jgi:hypothetical protein